MRIRALIAALAVAGASLGALMPAAHADPVVCASVHVEINDNVQDAGQCLP